MNQAKLQLGLQTSEERLPIAAPKAIVAQRSAVTQKTHSPKQATRWQFVVATGLRSSQHGQAPIANFRADLAHAILPPHLQLCWNREVGFHNNSPLKSSHPVVARPKMLDLSNGTIGRCSTGEDDLLVYNSSVNGSDVIDLAARLAQDLHCPLMAAHRTLHSIASNASQGQHLSLEDSRLLRSTAQSLAILANWTDDMLLMREASRGNCPLIRRRFHPNDWLKSFGDLMDEMAAAHGVSLRWIGWDETLPRLYLDPELLTRALMNLTTHALQNLQSGSQLRIQAGRSSDSTRMLRISLESDNLGLHPTTLNLINGDPASSAKSVPSTALMTARHFIEAQGGSLAANAGVGRTSSICIQLPIDTPESLVVNWLLRNAHSGRTTGPCNVHLFIVGAEMGTPDHANLRLQQAASERALVVRIAERRWMILELKPIEQAARSTTIQSVLAHPNLANEADYRFWQIKTDHPAKEDKPSDYFKWLEKDIYRSPEFSLNQLVNGDSHATRLPQLVELLTSQMRALMGRQPLILDGLLPPLPQARHSQRREPHHTIESGSCSAELTFGHIRIDNVSHRTADMLGSQEPAQVPGAQVVSEIIKQWKVVQSKLARLNGSLDSIHLASQPIH